MELGRAVDCADFSGYKPCRPGWLCEGCPHRRPVEDAVLLINLGALGNVIQTTAALPALRRARPKALVWFVTDAGNLPALANNPFVHRAAPFDWAASLVLRQMRFDLLLNADKAREACALASSVAASEKRGFALSARGAVEPFNPEARELYRLGLDDAFKFRANRKPGAQLLCETFRLPYDRDEYVLELTAEERAFVEEYRRKAKTAGRYAVGFNTGCSDTFPNKKMTAEQHIEVIRRLAKELPEAAILLLGGRAETDRNREIAAACRRKKAKVIETPTTEGLRRGILYVAACDCLVTGDTSALHMGIALRKWCVVWFGMTCASEIDLYGRGVKVVSNLPCSPCWKKECNFRVGDDVECVHGIDLNAIVAGVREGLSRGGPR